MAQIQLCPRCRQPVEIPQPAPELVRCLQCGTFCATQATSSEASAPVSADAVAVPPLSEPQTPPHSTLLVVGLFGLLLLGCTTMFGGVGLVYWIFQDAEKKPGPVAVDGSLKKSSEAPPVIITPPKIPPKIQAAIDRGAAHLKKRIHEKQAMYTESGTAWETDANIGATALAGLALLEAKVSPHDPAIQQVLTTVRRNAPKIEMIYALGSMLFFMNRLHEAEPLIPADRVLVRSVALRMVAGQLPDGRWTYLNPPITPKQEADLLHKLRANQYQPPNLRSPAPYWPSHSMTQFALLALWGSRQHDIPARPVFLASATRFHQSQYPDGSWDYNVARTGTKILLADSNTCAGLIALAMEKTLREDKEYQNQTAGDPPANPRADEQCDKAFAHLGGIIGRTKDESDVAHEYAGKILKADAWGDYYFLWCLERVAVIYDKKTIGGKDWYAWGSEVILQNQRPDGSWVDRHSDVPDTCFALLFLTRANLAKDLTESIRARAAK